MHVPLIIYISLNKIHKSEQWWLSGKTSVITLIDLCKHPIYSIENENRLKIGAFGCPGLTPGIGKNLIIIIIFMSLYIIT